MQRRTLMLGNLGCPNCAADLERAARKLPGVKTARVAFGPGTLHVEYDGNQLEERQIYDLVEQFGLEVAAALPG